MYRTISDFRDEASKFDCVTMAVARAESEETIGALIECRNLGWVEPVLVGDRNAILNVLASFNTDKDNWQIIDAGSDEEVMEEIVKSVEDGRSKGIIKGMINSSTFMSAILRSKVLNKKRFINHMSVFQMPDAEKIYFASDSGINISPGEEEKEKMLVNCVDAIHKLGIKTPKVALLSAQEGVTEKMPSTVHAANLAKKYNGRGCIVEGPIAFDVAISRENAEHKNLRSEVAGDVDLYIYPNIEAGNIVAKSWVYLNGAKNCGVVLGCEVPVSMGSRTDTKETKIDSIALAKLLAST